MQTEDKKYNPNGYRIVELTDLDAHINSTGNVEICFPLHPIDESLIECINSITHTIKDDVLSGILHNEILNTIERVQIIEHISKHIK